MYTASQTGAFPSDAITERLPGSEDHLRLLLEGISDYAIFMLDPTGHIATWNRGAERITGYTAAEITGQHYSRFYPEVDRAAGKPARELRIAAIEGRFENEGWRVRRDESLMWAHVIITALRDATGMLIGFARVTRDISVMKRVNGDVEGFTSSVSHDRRAPLVGRQGLHILACAPGPIVGEIASTLMTDMTTRDVRLVLRRLPTLSCDPGLARVVFTNLLSNAFKFTRGRAQAVVEVGVIDGKHQPVLYVRDNGIGLDPRSTDRVFGVFQRFHPEFHGTGVGLDTVQRIIHRHGGDIWAESSPNQGATFYFTFGPPPHAVAGTDCLRQPT